MAKQRTTEGENVESSKPSPSDDNIQESSVPSTEEVVIKEPDSRIDGILKIYPDYETLFVDKYGGAFTPDTPVAIRGEAVLYNNPYYKQGK